MIEGSFVGFFCFCFGLSVCPSEILVSLKSPDQVVEDLNGIMESDEKVCLH